MTPVGTTPTHPRPAPRRRPRARRRALVAGLMGLIGLAGLNGCGATKDDAMPAPSSLPPSPAESPNVGARYHIPVAIGPSIRLIYTGPGVAKRAEFTVTGASAPVAGLALDVAEEGTVDGYRVRLVDIAGADHLPTATAELVVLDPAGNRIAPA